MKSAQPSNAPHDAELGELIFVLCAPRPIMHFQSSFPVKKRRRKKKKKENPTEHLAVVSAPNGPSHHGLSVLADA